MQIKPITRTEGVRASLLRQASTWRRQAVQQLAACRQYKSAKAQPGFIGDPDYSALKASEYRSTAIRYMGHAQMCIDEAASLRIRGQLLSPMAHADYLMHRASQGVTHKFA